MRGRAAARAGVLAVTLVVLGLVFSGPGSCRVTAATAGGPAISADSWALIDARTGDTLAASRQHARHSMASTTKMMTAWVALHRLSLDRKVKVVPYRPRDVVESVAGLKAGEMVTVRDLFYAMILESANDAAHSLAVASSGSVSRFVKEMNRAARKMGLADTSFRNPAGLDQPGQYGSAADLARLGRRLMQIRRFRRIAATRKTTLKSLSPPLRLETTNSFLRDYRWVTGIKTGQTWASGFNLVLSGRKRGTELISVVFGAPTLAARNDGSARLLRYGFGLYRSRVAVRRGQVLARVPIRHGDGRKVPLIAPRAVRTGVRTDQELRVKTELPDVVEGPVRRGARLGSVRVSVDGRTIARTGLLAGEPVAAPAWSDRVRGGSALVAGLVVTGVALCVILVASLLARRRRAVRTRQRLRRVLRKY